jgi:hemolysin III
MNRETPSAAIPWNYDRAEIIADAIVHGIGTVLGVVGAAILLAMAFRYVPTAQIASIIIYSAGLLTMLGLSAAYNLWPVSPRKWFLRRFDHSAIYLLIAATYTPFLFLMKDGAIAAAMLTVVWLTAAAGISLKLAWPARFYRTSIALYLILGWSGALIYQPVADALSPVTLWLILIGGAFYSTGVIFHLWERLRFQNAIWHAFVLIGAVFHYTAVLTCVTISA